MHTEHTRQHTSQGMLASPAGDPKFCSRQAVRALVASTVAAVVLRADLLPQLCPYPDFARQSTEMKQGTRDHPTSHVLLLQARKDLQQLAWLYLQQPLPVPAGGAQNCSGWHECFASAISCASRLLQAEPQLAWTSAPQAMCCACRLLHAGLQSCSGWPGSTPPAACSTSWRGHGRRSRRQPCRLPRHQRAWQCRSAASTSLQP